MSDAKAGVESLGSQNRRSVCAEQTAHFFQPDVEFAGIAVLKVLRHPDYLYVYFADTTLDS
jgi:hypothetical protein